MPVPNASTIERADLVRAIRRIRTYAAPYYHSHAPRLQALVDTLDGMRPPASRYYAYELKAEEIALINWALYEIGV